MVIHGMYAVGIGSETVLKDADMVVQGLGNFDAWLLFNIKKNEVLE